jgi:predicted unusual protein kinase regulating ubiquinone biosynthesis (AarF/ABC1/UbiB family)
MQSASAPSVFSLAARASVLLSLIVEAAWVYLLHRLVRKGWLKRDDAWREARFGKFASRFVRVATKFRGGLIKLGQVASLRIDVIPDSMTEELVKLQDRVPAHAFASIAFQIEQELGRTVDVLFERFDPEPVAAASLGQVHRARDREGRDVAVKVLYPGVERSVAIDLRMVKLALWLFNPLVPPDLMSIYGQLANSLRGEMDYLREGAAAEQVTANLEADADLFSHLRIPRIDWETTSRRVLTMEYIEGDKINDREALEKRGVDVRESVEWATRAFLHQMFRDYFFHCDPHPGNLLVDLDGKVAIIDFGMNETISPLIMDGIRTNILAAVTRNESLWVDSMIEVGIIREEDREAARELAEIALSPEYYNLTPAEMIDIDFADYLEKMRGHLWMLRSFKLPDGLVAWGRAISLLYGLAAELAPGIRPLDIVGPYVLGFLQEGSRATTAESATPIRPVEASNP